MHLVSVCSLALLANGVYSRIFSDYLRQAELRQAEAPCLSFVIFCFFRLSQLLPEVLGVSPFR